MSGNIEGQSSPNSWPDSGAVMIDVQRIRELRVLIKTTEKELDSLESQGQANTNMAAKEMVVLEATRREVLRLKLRVISAAGETLGVSFGFMLAHQLGEKGRSICLRS